jgi:excisionase family DNA binding protein
VENATATAEPSEKYLTVAEVSSLFRVSVPTIYRRVADGQPPHIRIGHDGPIRIPAGELERLYDPGVSDDGPPAGGSFAGADSAERRESQNSGQSSSSAHAGREGENRESG